MHCITCSLPTPCPNQLKAPVQKTRVPWSLACTKQSANDGNLSIGSTYCNNSSVDDNIKFGDEDDDKESTACNDDAVVHDDHKDEGNANNQEDNDVGHVL